MQVGVNEIRFWLFAVSRIFHNARYAVVILAITHTFTRNFTGAMSCK